tara:strand:+ start:738 stop:938 length:201 start_codon:yes stop_codon:yes gene_type:complete
MIKVKIADNTGHTELMYSKNDTELINLLTSSSDAWIFADNKLVSANDIDLNSVQTIDILPPMVGGK